MKRSLSIDLGLLIFALLFVLGSGTVGYTWCSGDHPERSPGLPCGCHGGGGGGGDSDDVPPCGRPHVSVNLFTGDLVIRDKPVSYQMAGGDFPFVVTYSAQSGEVTTLGAHWMHAYGTRLFIDMPNGIGFLDGGTGREKYFPWDPVRREFSSSYHYACHANHQEDGGGNITEIGIIQEPPPGVGKRTADSPSDAMPPSARELKFTPDGKIFEVTIKGGPSLTFSYVEEFLTKLVDANGRETTLTYDGNDRLAQVTVPGGQHAHLTYDGSGRLSTVTDAVGDTYTYGYSGADTKVTSITEPSGREIEFTYTTFAGRPAIASIAVVGQPSTAVAFSYAPQGNGQLYVDVTQTKDGEPRVTRYIYENTNDEPNGRYLGMLLSVVQDCGDASHLNYTQAMAYNSHAKVIKYRDSYQTETGGKEHRHWYYYEDANLPLSLTKFIDGENADANPPTSGCPAYRFYYDSADPESGGFGNLTKVTTPESRELDINYVTGTRRISSIVLKDRDINNNPVDRTTSFTYWDATTGYQVKTITDGRGNVTTFYYDSNWYLDYIDPPFGGNVNVTANTVGDITAVTDGNGNTTSYQWDGIHRLTQITYPDVGAGQKSVHLDWTCCGLDQVTDENGRVTKAEYDDYTNWLTKLHEDYYGLNYLTQYTYDETGNPKTVTNGRGKTTSYTYNGADQVTRADYPDGTHEDWTYHDDGRVASHTDGRGRTTAFRYNADDELWGPAGSGYAAINYPNDADVNLSRDLDGLITAITDGSGTSSAAYYPSGWLKTLTNGVGKTVTYQYNGVGLVSRLTTPGSLNFDYGYNALNLPATVSNPNGVSLSFTYDNGGRLSRITHPGSYLEYQYNARDWITAVLNRNTGGVGVMCDARYYYQDGGLWDHAGNPLKKVENWGGLDYPTTYRYDHVYRLTEDTRRDGQGLINWQYLFGYDQVGNRTSRTRNGVTVTYTYDDNDKLVSASNGSLFGYDGSGNMTSVSGPLGSWSLVYDDESRPTSITYPTGSDSFLWNALGQRMRATLNGTVKRYVYDGDRVVEQTDDAGSVVARYTNTSPSYYAPLLHMWVASGGLSRYPLYDAQGTVRRLADDSGAKTDYYTHSAFGQEYTPSGTTPNPYRFGGAWGYITDTPGSGLLQLGARFYWPEVGRFIQQDPAGDGVNWYVYGYDNPLVWADPSGLWAPDVHLRWTECAAQEVGFSPELARAIAQAAYDIDNFWTLMGLPHFDFAPLGFTLQTKQEFADINAALAGTRWADFDRAGAIRALGEAVHAIQDDYAHGTARFWQHQSWMDEPNDPRRRQAALDAQAATRAFLWRWAARYAGRRW